MRKFSELSEGKKVYVTSISTNQDTDNSRINQWTCFLLSVSILLLCSYRISERDIALTRLEINQLMDIQG